MPSKVNSSGSALPGPMVIEPHYRTPLAVQHEVAGPVVDHGEPVPGGVRTTMNVHPQAVYGGVDAQRVSPGDPDDVVAITRLDRTDSTVGHAATVTKTLFSSAPLMATASWLPKIWTTWISSAAGVPSTSTLSNPVPPSKVSIAALGEHVVPCAPVEGVRCDAAQQRVVARVAVEDLRGGVGSRNGRTSTKSWPGRH